jgi:DNA-binding GntR family transcriptional regulator
MPRTDSRKEPRSNAPRRVPAVEIVLDHILTELDTGKLQPGSRVNAARISARLDLSVAPVREALSILAGRGVVQLLPDRGAVMRQLTPQDVIQLWEIVSAIGCTGVYMAAKAVAAGGDPMLLKERYELIRDAPTKLSPLRFLLRLNDYHWAAHELAGNRYLTLALERLGLPYWDHYLVKFIDVRTHIDGYLANYRRLHESIMAGDGGAASATMRYHAAWSVDLVRQGRADVLAMHRRQVRRAGA